MHAARITSLKPDEFIFDGYNYFSEHVFTIVKVAFGRLYFLLFSNSSI
jgi:hypothetical protein